MGSRHTIGWVAAAAIGGLLVLASVPRIPGIALMTPFLHLVAMRGWLLFGSLTVLVLLVVGFAGLHLRGNRTAMEGYGYMAAFFGLCLAFTAIANGAVLHSRGVDSSRHVTVGALGAIAEEEGDITVVSLNAFHSSVPAGDIVSLVRAASADFVFLPETLPELSREVASELGDGWQVFTDGPMNTRETSMLVSPEMGVYGDGGWVMAGAVLVRPEGDGPSAIAAHLTSVPVPFRLSVSALRAHLAWLGEIAEAYRLCEAIPGGIVGGDFNSTADHGTMGCGFVDAAQVAGIGGMGTWPSWLPPLLSTPIDRVFVDPESWDVVDGWIVDMWPSDHRAIVIRLTPLA